jgi:hypothetical protein
VVTRGVWALRLASASCDVGGCGQPDVVLSTAGAVTAFDG